MIQRHEHWPGKQDGLITADHEPRPEVSPEADTQAARDEKAARSANPRRLISPDAFDYLTGSRRRPRKLQHFALASGLLAAVCVVGFLVLKPMLRSSGATAPVDLRSSGYVAPPRTPDPSPRPLSNPIGRVVVVTQVPEDAWLELDGRLYYSGLGIDIPLRVVGDTSHSVAIHAQGYRSWTSEVYVPVDSLVRLEATLERLQTVRESRPASRSSEPQQRAREPAAQPAVTDTRPPLPIALRDSLILQLEEGRVFHEMGRYFDAADSYQHVLDRLAGARIQYRGSSVLQMLRARADSGLRAVRFDCRAEGKPECPQ